VRDDDPARGVAERVGEFFEDEAAVEDVDLAGDLRPGAGLRARQVPRGLKRS
jgi:hypothetical protein